MPDDITIVYPLVPQWTYTPIVTAGTAASIARGTPTRFNAAGAVSIMVDGDGSTGLRFTGIAKQTSNETASAAGVVVLWLPLPGIIYAAKAKDASAANTEAEVQALVGKRVIFDLTSSVWTIDTAASDAATNCVIILGGDYRTSTIHFAYSTEGAIIT